MASREAQEEGYVEVPGGRVWFRSVGEAVDGRARVPTLLVGGRYDECTPGHLEDMHERMAGSELRIIEDASHLCFAEQPGEFGAIVNRFLDRTDRGSSL